METETSLLLSSLNNQRNHVLGILDGPAEDACGARTAITA
jgi:hypothetical protein